MEVRLKASNQESDRREESKQKKQREQQKERDSDLEDIDSDLEDIDPNKLGEDYKQTNEGLQHTETKKAPLTGLEQQQMQEKQEKQASHYLKFRDPLSDNPEDPLDMTKIESI